MNDNYKYNLKIKVEYFISNYCTEDYEEFSQTAFNIIKEVLENKYVIQVAENYNLDRKNYFASDLTKKYVDIKVDMIYEDIEMIQKLFDAINNMITKDSFNILGPQIRFTSVF